MSTANDQTTTDDTTTDDQTTDDTRTGGADQTDWKAAHDKLQAESRKWEQRAKTNATAAKELETLRASTQTEQERAIAEAKAAARAEVLAEVGSKLVDAEFRSAFAGRGVDPDVLLDGLDRSKFLDETGNPDTKRITEWAGRIAPQTKQSAGSKDLGQGARPGATQPQQITDRSVLKTMTSAEIVKAQQEGRLDQLQGITR